MNDDLATQLADRISELKNELERTAVRWVRTSDRLPGTEDIIDNQELLVLINGASNPTTLLYDHDTNTFYDEDMTEYSVKWWAKMPKGPEEL
ncbi:MAG: hypothetical protein IJD14_04820 [Christensenellaceae bacterium]|nr:hypothetical protein [Christensenellaceae bacterium]